VRAALTGWARAVKDGYVPTADVWQLAGEVAAEVDQDVDQPEPFEGHDLLWTSSQQACLGLVESVLQKEDLPLDEATARACYAVIEPLTRSLDPTAAYEAASENTDPLTLSLNSVRPTALRCLIQLGQRLMTELVPPGLEAIIGLLDEHAGPAKDPSLAVAATIGEGLGKISTFAPEWFADHAAELLGHLTDAAPERRHWSDAVLSVALRVYYPGTTFFGLMRPWLERALSDDYESLDHVEGWASAGRSTREEVGRHIVSAFLGGRLTLDDELLRSVFRPERPELATQVLGILGWSADGGGFSTDELARSRQLIDWRLAEIEAGRAHVKELRQFFWWVRSAQFDAAWWLPILTQIAAADPDFDPNGMVGDALAAAGEEHPADALAVLDALLVDPEQVRVYDLLQAAPSVLLSAFRLGNEVVQADAQQLLDRLGRQGNLDLVASVEEARRRLDGQPG
jgi:hypothetical protein